MYQMSGKRRTVYREIILCFTLVFLICVLDQLSKRFMENFAAQLSSVPIIKNFFHLTLVHNTGAAFGIFTRFPQLFILLAVFAIIIIVLFLAYKFSILGTFEKIALCFISGGTLGNLIDRVRLGYVVDFIDFRVWPVFNVADSFITIGAIMLGWVVFSSAKIRRKG